MKANLFRLILAPRGTLTFIGLEYIKLIVTWVWQKIRGAEIKRPGEVSKFTLKLYPGTYIERTRCSYFTGGYRGEAVLKDFYDQSGAKLIFVKSLN